ncbi:MAG: hypothetical protein GY853_14045 [PVC group bacterium]|nr:hypothetical protein [PVC group bacterium]
MMTLYENKPTIQQQRKLNKCYARGEEYKLNNPLVFSCWEAASKAIKAGLIKNNRDQLNSFLNGFNSYKLTPACRVQ